jgi:S1-C subfamily serine protease
MYPERHARVLLVVAAALVGTAALRGQTAQVPAAKQRLTTVEIARRASGSVVTITTPTKYGSGVVVDAAGVIVTNLHVIRGERAASIKLANGDVYDDISVVDVDERKDLVVLKIKAFGLQAVPLGNSDQVRVGDRVVLIGTPQGLDSTVTDGLISAVRDSGDGYRLFQTSAAASPGSSGGGMFNELGELIGISSAQLSTGQNLNFGIPINYVRGLLATTEAKTTLAALVARFSPDTQPGPGPTANAGQPSADPAVVARVAAILAAAGIKAEKTGAALWQTPFAGKNASGNATVNLVGSMVVTTVKIGSTTGLTSDQLNRLLQASFSVNLAKTGIYDQQVWVLNETELRLLDGPALKEILDAVEGCADDVYATLNPAPSSPPPPLVHPSNAPTSPSVPGHEALLGGHAILITTLLSGHGHQSRENQIAFSWPTQRVIFLSKS